MELWWAILIPNIDTLQLEPGIGITILAGPVYLILLT